MTHKFEPGNIVYFPSYPPSDGGVVIDYLFAHGPNIMLFNLLTGEMYHRNNYRDEQLELVPEGRKLHPDVTTYAMKVALTGVA